MDLNFDGILQQYGLAIGVLIWSIYGLIRIVHNIAPEAFRGWQSARLDEQEHRQETERNLQETQKLERLAALGNLAFLQENQTQLTAETIDLLRSNQEFVNRQLDAKLDVLILRSERLVEIETKLSLLIQLWERNYVATNRDNIGDHSTSAFGDSGVVDKDSNKIMARR